MSRPLRQRPVSPDGCAEHEEHRDGSMAGLCGHWVRRQIRDRREGDESAGVRRGGGALALALPRRGTRHLNATTGADIGAGVEGWRTTHRSKPRR
jgi:hypothetical protein